jgi:cytochrome c peroxidase
MNPAPSGTHLNPLTPFFWHQSAGFDAHRYEPIFTVIKETVMERIKQQPALLAGLILAMVFLASRVPTLEAQGDGAGQRLDGKRLFERETFGGNGRTCLTCHSRDTGTVSPADALARFQKNPKDPLFLHDGSDDGQGHGVSRILQDATILITIPLPPNVTLKDEPNARSITLRRGIPTTLNTPAFDPVLMLDGRAPTLMAQADDAIRGHAQNTQTPGATDLLRIAQFQVTDDFFSSRTLRDFARGGLNPVLPEGNTDSEKRGRAFFEDVPIETPTQKIGLCASCHSGPLLNEMNRFNPPAFKGERFQSVGVSELNFMGNPVRTFIFDGTTEVTSADPGRALITGRLDDVDPVLGPLFNSVNAFKIPILRGVAKTAPYFHDNSAKTLEDVAAHYALFFFLITGGNIDFSEQDQKDMVAFLKLLD